MTSAHRKKSLKKAKLERAKKAVQEAVFGSDSFKMCSQDKNKEKGEHMEVEVENAGNDNLCAFGGTADPEVMPVVDQNVADSKIEPESATFDNQAGTTVDPVVQSQIDQAGLGIVEDEEDIAIINFFREVFAPKKYSGEGVQGEDTFINRLDRCYRVHLGLSIDSIEEVDPVLNEEDNFKAETVVDTDAVINNQSVLHIESVLNNVVETALNTELTNTEAALNTELTKTETALNTELTKTETALNTELTNTETALNTELTNTETALNTELTNTETIKTEAVQKTESVENVELNSEVRPDSGRKPSEDEKRVEIRGFMRFKCRFVRIFRRSNHKNLHKLSPRIYLKEISRQLDQEGTLIKEGTTTEKREERHIRRNKCLPIKSMFSSKKQSSPNEQVKCNGPKPRPVKVEDIGQKKEEEKKKEEEEKKKAVVTKQPDDQTGRCIRVDCLFPYKKQSSPNEQVKCNGPKPRPVKVEDIGQKKEEEKKKEEEEKKKAVVTKQPDDQTGRCFSLSSLMFWKKPESPESGDPTVKRDPFFGLLRLASDVSEEMTFWAKDTFGKLIKLGETEPQPEKVSVKQQSPAVEAVSSQGEKEKRKVNKNWFKGIFSKKGNGSSSSSPREGKETRAKNKISRIRSIRDEKIERTTESLRMRSLRKLDGIFFDLCNTFFLVRDRLNMVKLLLDKVNRVKNISKAYKVSGNERGRYSGKKTMEREKKFEELIEMFNTKIKKMKETMRLASFKMEIANCVIKTISLKVEEAIKVIEQYWYKWEPRIMVQSILDNDKTIEKISNMLDKMPVNVDKIAKILYAKIMKYDEANEILHANGDLEKLFVMMMIRIDEIDDDKKTQEIREILRHRRRIIGDDNEGEISSEPERPRRRQIERETDGGSVSFKRRCPDTERPTYGQTVIPADIQLEYYTVTREGDQLVCTMGGQRKETEVAAEESPISPKSEEQPEEIQISTAEGSQSSPQVEEETQITREESDVVPKIEEQCDEVHMSTAEGSQSSIKSEEQGEEYVEIRAEGSDNNSLTVIGSNRDDLESEGTEDANVTSLSAGTGLAIRIRIMESLDEEQKIIPLPDAPQKDQEATPLPEETQEEEEPTPVPEKSPTIEETTPVPEESPPMEETAPLPNETQEEEKPAKVEKESPQIEETTPLPQETPEEEEEEGKDSCKGGQEIVQRGQYIQEGPHAGARYYPSCQYGGYYIRDDRTNYSDGIEYPLYTPYCPEGLYYVEGEPNCQQYVYYPVYPANCMVPLYGQGYNGIHPQGVNYQYQQYGGYYGVAHWPQTNYQYPAVSFPQRRIQNVADESCQNRVEETKEDSVRGEEETVEQPEQKREEEPKEPEKQPVEQPKEPEKQPEEEPKKKPVEEPKEQPVEQPKKQPVKEVKKEPKKPEEPKVEPPKVEKRVRWSDVVEIHEYSDDEYESEEEETTTNNDSDVQQGEKKQPEAKNPKFVGAESKFDLLGSISEIINLADVRFTMFYSRCSLYGLIEYLQKVKYIPFNNYIRPGMRVRVNHNAIRKSLRKVNQIWEEFEVVREIFKSDLLFLEKVLTCSPGSQSVEGKIEEELDDFKWAWCNFHKNMMRLQEIEYHLTNVSFYLAELKKWPDQIKELLAEAKGHYRNNIWEVQNLIKRVAVKCGNHLRRMKNLKNLDLIEHKFWVDMRITKDIFQDDICKPIRFSAKGFEVLSRLLYIVANIDYNRYIDLYKGKEENCQLVARMMDDLKVLGETKLREVGRTAQEVKMHRIRLMEIKRSRRMVNNYKAVVENLNNLVERYVVYTFDLQDFEYKQFRFTRLAHKKDKVPIEVFNAVKERKDLYLRKAEEIKELAVQFASLASDLKTF